MTQHSIKINRAWTLSGIPAMPTVRAAIMAAISPEMIASMTSKQLAMTMQALNAHWHSAVAWTEQDACGNGYIWDERNKALRDIAPAPKA